MIYLCDTNVMVRLVQAADPLHDDAAQAVERLLSKGHELSAAPQSIYEFWAVATRPQEQRGGLGYDPARARLEIDGLLEIMP